MRHLHYHKLPKGRRSEWRFPSLYSLQTQSVQIRELYACMHASLTLPSLVKAKCLDRRSKSQGAIVRCNFVVHHYCTNRWEKLRETPSLKRANSTCICERPSMLSLCARCMYAALNIPTTIPIPKFENFFFSHSQHLSYDWLLLPYHTTAPFFSLLPACSGAHVASSCCSCTLLRVSCCLGM